MDLAQRRRDFDGETQEGCHLHGSAELPGQRLAAEILQHQNGPRAVLQQLKRFRRPGAVQFVSQLIFVREAFKALRCRMLGGRKHGQHDVALAVGSFTADPAQQNAVVIAQDLRTVGPTCAHER